MHDQTAVHARAHYQPAHRWIQLKRHEKTDPAAAAPSYILIIACAAQPVPEIARSGNDLFSGRKSTNFVLNDFRPPKFGGRTVLKTPASQAAGLV